MRILAIDMGTGTQDILLFDSNRPIENSIKMVMPSATEVAARRIREAHERKSRIILTGSVAGGGPCVWALEDYLRSGLEAFASAEAAATFNDDLERVRELGVKILSDPELERIEGIRVRLGDLDLEAIGQALSAFEEPPDVDGYALGCLDHGAAPPEISDRTFRFDHIRRTVEGRNDLLAFAFAPRDLPPYLTRAKAMVAGAGTKAPVAFMDTGPAAALGALHDERVGATDEQIVLNLGNMHLLGFHLRGRRIASLFEHHTGELATEQIEILVRRLSNGSLKHAEVFETNGHGAFHPERGIVGATLPKMIATIGPQRHRLKNSPLSPYFAVPYGDMMISGCFGLVRAFAEIHSAARDAVESQLGPLPG